LKLNRTPRKDQMRTPPNTRPTATRLRKLRRDRGMRQRDLADVLGVHLAAVSLWERGGIRPHPRTARALEIVFGEPIEALIARDTTTTNGADPKASAA
jgi:transcriptional regulator with XRE-family HTH domain